jgi:hypothetical protein
MVDMMDRNPNRTQTSVWAFINDLEEQSYRIEDFLANNAPKDGDRSSRSRHDKLSKDFFNLHEQFLDVKELASTKRQSTNDTR